MNCKLNLFPKGSRGISVVIGTLIAVLLVIIAVSIVWVVIRNVIEKNSNDVSSLAVCIGVNLKITSVEACPSGSTSCDATVTRRSGGDEIEAVRLVITDGTSSLSGDSLSALNPLDIVTIEATGSSLESAATKARVAALVLDNSGDIVMCEYSDEYSY